MANYTREAESEAKDAARNFVDQIIEALVATGRAPLEMSAYSNSYLHERVIDRSYRPAEAIELLEELDGFEDDPGVPWDDWRSALSAMAAYTYGNAVNHKFEELMRAVNSNIEYFEGDDPLTEYESRKTVHDVLDLDPPPRPGGPIRRWRPQE
jgi:hypothetical protein